MKDICFDGRAGCIFVKFREDASDYRLEKLRNINSLIILFCRVDVAGIQVDGGQRQFVGEKTNSRFDAPVTNRQETIASFNCLARRGRAGYTRVRSRRSDWKSRGQHP